MTTTNEKNKQAIAGILVALGFWAAGAWILYGPRGPDSSDPEPRRAVSDVHQLRASAIRYRGVHGQNPTSLHQLAAHRLFRGLTTTTKDPWGAAYALICPSTDGPCGVLSAGPDGEFGTEDDIRSWSDPRPPREPWAVTPNSTIAAERG